MNPQNRYLKLWSNNDLNQRMRGKEKNQEAFYKKAMDGLCLKVDMCETLEDYLHNFCEGMNELIDLGVPRKQILDHKLLFAKILRLGSDIIEASNKQQELFYIGLFVDMKISSCWYKSSFYRMIINMLKTIAKQGAKLPTLMKEKIIKLVQVENHSLYALHFDHNALKNTA